MSLYLYMYLYLFLDMYFYLYWTPLCNKSWRETSIKSLPILPFCPSALSENPWRSTVKGNPVWLSSPKSILISCFQPTLLRSRQSTKPKVLLGFLFGINQRIFVASSYLYFYAYICNLSVFVDV